MKTTALLALLLACCTLAPCSYAGHRVKQINGRLEDQSGRIAAGFDQKNKNKRQLMRADNASYRASTEEQAMRTRHGGKLTRHDQNVLNRQLNRNSARIQHGRHCN
jgi:hypothetical protein